ncbi:MAG: isoprenylcysteine carboxylmethyltransferase family protein [archaeon]|nr:isoprenylcysteine carboxylmethyltransferase family protein [archaeon]
MNEKLTEKKKKSKHSAHDDREDLGGEHPLGDLIQLIFLITFLILIAVDVLLIKSSLIILVYSPFFFFVSFFLGSITLAIAVYISKSGLHIVFNEIRDPPQVITKGVFSYLRHPVYLGALLLYLGIIFITLSVISLPLFIIICIFYNYISAYEEKYLEVKFGQEYLDYKKMVSRWIPKIFKK